MARTLLLLLFTALQAAAAPREDLVALAREWREFQRPPRVDGVPDYGRKAMSAQAQALPRWRARLDTVDTSGFTLVQKDDLALLRAEMMGLDFDHRVLSPWTRDPAFYVTVFDEQSDQPAREGEWADAATELWALSFPLSPPAEASLLGQLSVIPPLLAQAKRNLTGNGEDLWTMASGPIREQRTALEHLRPRVSGSPKLVAAVDAALSATTEYGAWVASQAKTRRGPSGVGVEHYDWYLANVALVPFTWSELVVLMERELDRARAGLAEEELRNRGLPPLEPATTVEEHQRRFDEALKTYLAFLRKNDFITWYPWMEQAFAVFPGGFDPKPPLEFFSEVEARDPMPLRLHLWHFVDLAAMEKLPPASPIRRLPPLYNIFNTRTEGVATALEELMMHAGLYDGRPRGRELIYVMLAQRAARAMGDLRMHANQWTLEQASAFASSNTPRGWLRLDGRTVRGEQHLFLRRPSYGTSYIVGKAQLDQLIARTSGGRPLPMKALLDGLLRIGPLPMSLVQKELEAELGVPRTAPK
ncbi:MAG TPA: DUF885 family protein [Thermoanaerobaculaceae bacterium]|nr:DUF885 family protein [Thermoanaerobaculaceae bacterium]